MSAQVRSWFGKAVPNVISHPSVRAFVAKWLQIRSERDPVLADFWHSADEGLMDSSILFMKGEIGITPTFITGVTCRSASASRCRG